MKLRLTLTALAGDGSAGAGESFVLTLDEIFGEPEGELAQLVRLLAARAAFPEENLGQEWEFMAVRDGRNDPAWTPDA